MQSNGAPRQPLSLWQAGVLLLTLLVTACAASRPRPQPGPERALSLPKAAPVETFELVPAQPGVASYSEVYPVVPPCSPACAEVRRQLLAAASRQRLRVDARLDLLVADLVRVAREDSPLDYEVVEFLLSHYGIVEPTPHLFLFFSESSDAQLLPANVRAMLTEALGEGRYDRLGVAVASQDRRQVIGVALQQSRITMAPVPRQLPTGGAATLQFTVAAGYSHVEVLISRGDGSVGPAKVHARADGQWQAHLACGQSTDRIQVEVTAEDSLGAGVLANFPVWCGTPAPSRFTFVVERGGTVTPAAAEQRIADLINRDRLAHGLSALPSQPELAAVAREYSAEMVRTGVVAHRSPESGEAQDRLRRASVVRGLIMENLARAGSAESAHQSLMNSPGHRSNILSSEATEMGIGVATKVTAGATEIIVTELFSRVPPPLDVAGGQARLNDAFTAAIQVRPDLRLSALAQVAALRAAQMPDGESTVRETPGLAAAAVHYERLRVVLLAVSTLAEITASALPKELAKANVGFGLAQGNHPRLGPQTIFCVVLFGQPK